MPTGATLRTWLAPICGALFILGVAWGATSRVGSSALSATAGQALTAGAAVYAGAAVWRRRWPPALVLALLALGVGLWRAAGALEPAVQPWSAAPTKAVVFQAVVDAPVETPGAVAYAYVRPAQFEGPADIAPPAGRIQIAVPPLPVFDLGDRVEIRGHVRPVDPATPQGRWLLSQRVVATATFPDVLPIGTEPEPSAQMALHRLRSALQDTAKRMLPQPHASLVTGLLVGATGQMPDSFRQALVASGTSHVVVVSGYNVTLVAGVVAGLLRGRQLVGLVGSLVGVWAFTLLAGGTSPAIRAAVMATVTLLALRTGRGSDALAGLGWAVAIMLFIDPSLIGSLSFQLSVLATLGLITLYPRIAGRLPGLHHVVREPVAASLAAGLATLPLLVATFHQVSVVAPLTNALIAPLIPIVTIAAGIGVPLAALFPPATALIGSLLAIPTAAVVSTIEISAALPAAILPVGEVPAMVIVLYGFGLVGWAVAGAPEGQELVSRFHGMPWSRAAAAGVAASVAMLLVAWSGLGASPAPLVISVLDVGQGDAIFMRTPAGHAVLIDGGPNPSALLGHLGRRLGLVERNFSLAVLTHADGERLPGATAAAERYTPLLALGPPEGSTAALYDRWQASSGQHIRVETPLSIALEPGLTIEVLPTSPVVGLGPGSAPPRRALLLRVVHGDVSFLIAPPLTAEAALQVTDEGWPLRADALLVPRHGDATALSARLVALLDPSYAVLSVGARNRDNLPAKSTLDLLATVPLLRTDLHGTVELHSDGHQLWVIRERVAPSSSSG